jgi:RNA polymerase sigma factor (sigma-70 family)
MRRGIEAAVLRGVGQLFEAGTVSGLAEGQLLERYVGRRDALAFEALVARHGPMVWGVCRRILRDAHDAEDAFQATFLVLARRAASIRDRTVLGPWLHAVASKTALRARANARRRRALERAAGPGADVDPPDEPDHRELRGVLDEEIGRLPEKYRAPVTLCYFEGLTHDEAAARLRWPVGTVRGRLARARGRLRDRLTRRGVTLAGALAAAGVAGEAGRAASPTVVPTALFDATIRAAAALGASGLLPASGVVSASVYVLTQQTLRSLLMAKLTMAAAGLTVAGVLAAGSLVYAFQDPTPAAVPSAPAAPAPVAQPAQAAPSIPTPASTPAQASNATTPVFPYPPTQPPAGLVPSTPVQEPPTPEPVANPVPTRYPYVSTPVPAPVEPPPPTPDAAEDVSAYLERTRRQVAAAIKQLTDEEQRLNSRLTTVRQNLERLKAMSSALDASRTPTRRSAYLPQLDAADPFGEEPELAPPSEIRRLPPSGVDVPRQPIDTPLPGPVVAGEAAPPTMPGPANEARLDALESKLDTLINALSGLRNELNELKQSAPPSRNPQF